MKKALIITGPTATGKTSLAQKVAKQVNGALISADSIQVYKGCDIISGKDIPKDAIFTKEQVTDIPSYFEIGKWEIKNIPLYLTDVADPTHNFSVADFLNLSEKFLELTREKGKVPIFVGGTTLYVRALLEKIDTISIPPDFTLRDRLAGASVEELQGLLAKYDKERLAEMNDSDINNSRRLVRAIEVAKTRNNHQETNRSILSEYYFLTIGLESPRDILKEKIDIRVNNRIENGAFEEAKILYKKYDSLSENVKNANGYRQLFNNLDGKITKNDAIQKWKNSEYLHAKNQMTFFKKMSQIEWYSTEGENYPNNTIEKVKNWLQHK